MLTSRCRSTPRLVREDVQVSKCLPMADLHRKRPLQPRIDACLKRQVISRATTDECRIHLPKTGHLDLHECPLLYPTDHPAISGAHQPTSIVKLFSTGSTTTFLLLTLKLRHCPTRSLLEKSFSCLFEAYRESSQLRLYLLMHLRGMLLASLESEDCLP